MSTLVKFVLSSSSSSRIYTETNFTRVDIFSANQRTCTGTRKILTTIRNTTEGQFANGMEIKASHWEQHGVWEGCGRGQGSQKIRLTMQRTLLSAHVPERINGHVDKDFNFYHHPGTSAINWHSLWYLAFGPSASSFVIIVGPYASCGWLWMAASTYLWDGRRMSRVNKRNPCDIYSCIRTCTKECHKSQLHNL